MLTLDVSPERVVTNLVVDGVHIGTLAMTEYQWQTFLCKLHTRETNRAIRESEKALGLRRWGSGRC